MQLEALPVRLLKQNDNNSFSFSREIFIPLKMSHAISKTDVNLGQNLIESKFNDSRSLIMHLSFFRTKY